MGEKIYFLSFLIIIIFICLSPIDANETATNETDLGNFSEDSQIGSFEEINYQISVLDEINLDKDYAQKLNDSQIYINKSVSIDGCGHQIIADDSVEIFNLNSSGAKINFTIKNTTFINANKLFDENATDNITFIDCSFVNNNTIVNPCSKNYEANKNTTGEIAGIVQKVAKLIVGSSTDYAAAKKLATWVANNIQHEVKEGLYQSAETTLFRGMGNCLATHNLFLQMCAAVGLTKKHKLYFVHTGTIVYGQRHFFAIIDHIAIDVDVKKGRPWANCPTNRKITCITEYPYLPLLINY